MSLTPIQHQCVYYFTGTTWIAVHEETQLPDRLSFGSEDFEDGQHLEDSPSPLEVIKRLYRFVDGELIISNR